MRRDLRKTVIRARVRTRTACDGKSHKNHITYLGFKNGPETCEPNSYCGGKRKTPMLNSIHDVRRRTRLMNYCCKNVREHGSYSGLYCYDDCLV